MASKGEESPGIQPHMKVRKMHMARGEMWVTCICGHSFPRLEKHIWAFLSLLDHSYVLKYCIIHSVKYIDKILNIPWLFKIQLLQSINKRFYYFIHLVSCFAYGLLIYHIWLSMMSNFFKLFFQLINHLCSCIYFSIFYWTLNLNFNF